MSRNISLRGTLIRVIPAAFVIGATMELFMTYVRIGDETFYDTAKRLEMQRQEERKRAAEELEKRVREREKQKAAPGDGKHDLSHRN